MTTPAETVRLAFFTILSAAFTTAGDPEVLKYKPFLNVPQNSISFLSLGGPDQYPGLGRRVSSTQTGMWESHRIQIDIYNSESVEAAIQIADRIGKAITAALATFETTYGVCDVRRLIGPLEAGPSDPPENVAHVILDYTCKIETQKTDPSP
jgi:hypothetical protein